MFKAKNLADYTFPEIPYQLGDRLRDQVSGIEGVASAATYHLNGCVHIELTPDPTEKEESPDSFWSDWQNFEQLKEGGERKVLPTTLVPIIGARYKDKLSNAIGIVDLVAIRLYGDGFAVQLTPPGKEGKPRKGEHYTFERLEYIDQGVRKEVKANPGGCSTQSPPSMR